MKNEAQMKAVAKRPKLIKLLSKGMDFHKLKEAAGISGGFIRKLMAAKIVERDEDRIVSFAKGMEKEISKIDVDEPTERKSKKDKPVKKKSKKSEDEDDEDEEDDQPRKKKGKKDPEEDEEEDEEDDKPRRKKGKADKPEKKSKVEKRAVIKLVKPIKDLPANHKLDAEYYDGFWWVHSEEMDKAIRIATQNLTIIKEK